MLGTGSRHRRWTCYKCYWVKTLNIDLTPNTTSRHSGPPSSNNLSFLENHWLTSCWVCMRNVPEKHQLHPSPTVIGLVDASVSIEVAVRYGNYKNRLGAYHAPIHTFLDFSFLRTLPVAQIRNGFAELIKISACSHLRTFNPLDKYCELLIRTGFGRADGLSLEVRTAADEINHADIYEMLRLETPNLHEIGLDKVIAYGHTYVKSPGYSSCFMDEKYP